MGKRKHIVPDVAVSQSEADLLLAMKKGYFGQERYDFPFGGRQIAIPVFSLDRRNEFSLDVCSKRLDLSKYTFMNRTRKTIVLARVDLLQSARHFNPDGRVIEGPHIHRYREGFGDKWAEPLPREFGDASNPFSVLERFMEYCHIVAPPRFIRSTIIESQAKP